MRNTTAMVVAAALALPAAVGCHAAPRQRPVEMGPVDAGTGSVESVRRQLQGVWDLAALELFSPAGERIAAQAGGRLQYDEYGNLTMRGTITGGPAVDSSVLNITGRVVIDPRKQTLQLDAITAPSADEKRIDPQLSAKHVRYYELNGDVLKITVKAADGSPSAIATWKKVG